MKKAFGTSPELFFMGMGLFWMAQSYLLSGSKNYFALLITWLLFLQLFYKNRFAGLMYGLMLGSFSVYNVITALSGFPDTGVALTVTGSETVSAGLYGIGIVMAAVMVYKYVTAKVNYDESVLTTTY